MKTVKASDPETVMFSQDMLEYLKTKGVFVKEKIIDNSFETLLNIDHVIHDDIGMLASPLDSEPCEIGIMAEDIFYLIQDIAPDVDEQFWQDMLAESDK